MAKTSCKKGQYYCNTDKKCKPIPEGYTVREDGFLVKEGWSAKYKKSIDCNNPKGFSQKAHCAGKKKKMTEESNPRIARKKGQPAKSKKHSSLIISLKLQKDLSRKFSWITTQILILEQHQEFSVILFYLKQRKIITMMVL